MLIVITPERFLDNEIQLLNEFAKCSGVIFHIRKPSASQTELTSFLEKLDAAVLKNGMLHSHHGLVDEFNLKGKHFTETQRLSTEDFNSTKIKSSSFHSITEVENDKNDFDYHFLSPVFDSISKENYQGKGFDVSEIGKKIIALGGINAGNAAKAQTLGFEGIAVLGAIWKNSNPMKAFEEIKQSYEQSFT